MDIKALLTEKVAKKASEPRKRSGKFAPSRMGRCYRFQIAQRRGLPESDPVGPQLQMTFDIGTMIHRYIQGFLPEDDCEVLWEGDDIKGYCDYVGDDFVVDFKTVGFFPWKHIEKLTDATIGDEKSPDCFQLMTYAYLMNKPLGYLVYVKKDNMEVRQFCLKLSEWKGRVESELSTLRQYWEKEGLPKGYPRAYGGRECQYCSYAATCPDRIDPPKKKATVKKKKSAF